MLNSRLVTDGRVAIRRAGVWLSRIFATVAVHLIQMFGFGVVGLKFVVVDRPGWRDAAVMSNLAKVFPAQTEQRRTVEFRIPTDVIVRVRMKLVAVDVAPRFLR